MHALGDDSKWDPNEELQARQIENIQFDYTADLSQTKSVLFQFAPKSIQPLSSSVKVPFHDLQYVRSLFTAIVDRAARYTALAITCVAIRIVNHVSSVATLDAAIDGSIFHKHKGFKEELQRAVNECCVAYRSYFGLT
jgi:hexokinase